MCRDCLTEYTIKRILRNITSAGLAQDKKEQLLYLEEAEKLLSRTIRELHHEQDKA